MSLWFSKASPRGAAEGCPQAPLPHPKAALEGRAAAYCAQALLTQRLTPCVNARQLLPRPLFAQPAPLCLPFGGSRWKEMAFRPPANGARQLQTPAPRILQHCRSSSPCPRPVQAAQ